MRKLRLKETAKQYFAKRMHSMERTLSDWMQDGISISALEPVPQPKYELKYGAHYEEATDYIITEPDCGTRIYFTLQLPYAASVPEISELSLKMDSLATRMQVVVDEFFGDTKTV